MVDEQAFQIITTERDGTWTAHAVRVESGERFGIETSGADANEAADRLARWLEWESEHMQAIAALQLAQRDYHRAMADAAFVLSPDADGGRPFLDALNAAREALDDVRARRPPT